MDLSHLNLASLQLSDFPSAKIKIDELFLAFLCESETSKLVDYLLDEVASASSDGSTSPIPRSPPDTSPLQPPRSPVAKSPKKRSQSEMQQASGVASSVSDVSSTSSLTSPCSDDAPPATSARRRSNIDSIPPFFVPGRHRRSYRLSHGDEQSTIKLNEIEACFKPYPGERRLLFLIYLYDNRRYSCGEFCAYN